ncbi:MAG: DUF4041 domain-containing protein [Roseibium sp.]|uniref:DUF4041 domain-containing protein n=1 Tax=Roseibium sp. TaxID=1936156 RepID=UPI003D9C2872
MEPGVIFLFIWLPAAPVLLVAWIWTWIILRYSRKQSIAIIDGLEERAVKLEDKYGGLISEEAELERLRSETVVEQSRIEELRTSYAEKKVTFDRLQHELAVYDERLSFAELGMYEPHFDFNDSEAFKERIKTVRRRQKAMVSSKHACICPTNWTVDGSLSKGKTMINRQMRLTMRAFNNECEAAIANTRWNNVIAMENRVLKAVIAIDASNSSMNLVINDAYVALKIEELRLTHEYREQLKQERDERVELARAEREEKKLLAEAEKADKEEQKYQDLLAKARKEAEVDVDNERLRNKIAELETSLAEAHATGERARAMAELTKSGYVYIVSNVGSFGEDVVKIGLTRRLDPNDRVRELGDASVPFSFDTHAMIYSEEAPALELALHREFGDKRINMSNLRKEFFRVSLNEVEDAVRRLAPDASFFKDREAQDWQETLARRKQLLADTAYAQSANAFPATL